jgi:serine/threonine protein phosphatase PrpC
VYERGDALVVVLADGGGSLRGGETASRSLVAVVEAAVHDPTFVLEDVRPWIDLFLATDAGLAANRAGETTGVVVVLGRHGFMGVSIGNSEAWVVKPVGLDNLTVGQHTKQRLGSNRATLAVFERPTLCGMLVIATDGLFAYAASEVIARTVRASKPGEAAGQLIELVRLRSGKVADDISMVLVWDHSGTTEPS